MLKAIGAYDAKTKLPEILRRVKKGEGFTITKHGKPVADLIPSRISSEEKTKSAISNILKAKRPVVSDRLLSELKNARRK